jgi:hypothetical protein
MATYGYSAGYQGGGPSAVPSGYIEAYAQAGRNIGQGVQAIGNAIGDSLARYGQNKAENEFLTSRLESLAPYLQTVAQSGNIMDKNTPESKLLGDIEKFSSMSIPQKKATLLNAEFYLDRADKQRQREIQDQLAQQNLALGQFQLSEAQRRAQLEQNLGQALGQVLSIPTTQTITQYTPVEKPVSNLGLKEPTIETPPGGAVAGVEETYTEMVPTQVEQPVGYQDRFKQAVDVFRKLNVPVNVDAITKALEATGTMRPTTVEPVGTMGAVVRFGDKEQFVPAPKADIGDMLKLRGVTIDFPEFRGTAPTEKEATDFRDQYSNVLSSRRNIQRLLEIAQMGKAMQQTPEIKAEAEQLSRAAQGALRLDIIGPGTVTDSDRKLLENIVRNPTDIFSLQSSNVKSLKSLLERAGSGIESKAKSIGLEVLKPTQQQPAAGGRAGGVLRYNPLTKKFE